MTKLLLALLSSAAVAGAAQAQQYEQPKPSQQPSMRQSQPQPPRQSAREQISPRALTPDQVRKLQQALNDKGGMKLGVDGRWGPKSAAALRRFQHEHGIQANGMLDKQTAAALGAPIAGQGESPPPPNVSPGAPPSGQQPQKNPGQTVPPSPPAAPGSKPQ